jgi:hypothetical protein
MSLPSYPGVVTDGTEEQTVRISEGMIEAPSADNFMDVLYDARVEHLFVVQLVSEVS